MQKVQNSNASYATIEISKIPCRRYYRFPTVRALLRSKFHIPACTVLYFSRNRYTWCWFFDFHRWKLRKCPGKNITRAENPRVLWHGMIFTENIYRTKIKKTISVKHKADFSNEHLHSSIQNQTDSTDSVEILKIIRNFIHRIHCRLYCKSDARE